MENDNGVSEVTAGGSGQCQPSWTQLYHAVRNGDIQVVEKCLFYLGEDCYTVSLQDDGYLCCTALEVAARAGQLSVVQCLVLHDYFLRLIHWPVLYILLGKVVEVACKHGQHYSMVEFVLDYIHDRKDVKSETEPSLYDQGSTDNDRLQLVVSTSHYSARYGRPDIISMLVRNCYTSTSSDTKFILDRVVYDCFIEGIRFNLLPDDVVEIIVATDYWKNLEELHKAVYLGNRELVDTLIGMEDFWTHIHFPTTNHSRQDTSHFARIAVSVFELAAVQDDIEMFRLLYNEARKRKTFSESESDLLEQVCDSLCERGRVKIVESFLTDRWPAVPMNFGRLWQQRLSVAMYNNRSAVAMLILERFYSKRTKSGPRLANLRRDLTHPVRNEDFKLLQKLIECASSLASTRREYDKFVRDVFMEALGNGRWECVTFLEKNYSKEINKKKKGDWVNRHSVHAAAFDEFEFGSSLPKLEMAFAKCKICKKKSQHLSFDNERSHLWRLIRKGDWFEIGVSDDFLKFRLKQTSLPSMLDERKVRLMFRKMAPEFKSQLELLDFVDAAKFKEHIFNADLHHRRHHLSYRRDLTDLTLIRNLRDHVCKFLIVSCGATCTSLDWHGALTGILHLEDRYQERFRRCVHLTGWRINDPTLAFVAESRRDENFYSMKTLCQASVDVSLKALSRIAVRRAIREHSGLIASLTDRVLALHVHGYLPKPLVDFVLFRDEIIFP